MSGITLTNNTISNKEMDELADWIRTYPQLTKGQLTLDFEKKFCEKTGAKYALFVNSGSSANLLMLSFLVEYYRSTSPVKKVAVPTLCWATDLAPVIQLGLTPVLVDCNLEDLSVDLDDLEAVFETEKPEVLLLVSILGLTPKMAEIRQLCYDYNVILIEDHCESLGTSIDGTVLGSVANMASYSLYYSHHLSTIEGGVITTNSDYVHSYLTMMRSHGWSRDLDEKQKRALRRQYDVSEFNDRFTFYCPGYNLRATDLQAFIGLSQLDKLEQVKRYRWENYKLYIELLKPYMWTPKQPDNVVVSNFGMPIIHEKRDEIVKALTAAGIECRPLVCGSMGNQPMYTTLYGCKPFMNAGHVDRHGLYVPNHDGMSFHDVHRVCDTIIEVVRRNVWEKEDYYE